MKKEVKKYFIGCALILVLLKQSVQQRKHECKTFTEDGFLNADCREEKLDEVPQDLDPLIQRLDLSRNDFQKLNESSFLRYPLVISLVMKGIDLNFHPDYYLFRPLKLLKTLDLTASRFGDKTVFFYWPPDLKELKLSYLERMYNVDVSNLGKLEKLEVDHSPVLAFPIFKRYAPVVYINLNSTLIGTMRPEDLAPLCLVERLEMSFHFASRILTAPKFCECNRLNAWIKLVGIEATPEALGCRSLPSECDLDFTDETLALRSKCLSKHGKRSIIFYLGIGFMVVLLTIAAAVYIYIRKRRKDNLD